MTNPHNQYGIGGREGGREGPSKIIHAFKCEGLLASNYRHGRAHLKYFKHTNVRAS